MGLSKLVTTTALAVFGVAGAAATPAAGATGWLLPHPGPDGLVWVNEWFGDGGVVSGGGSTRLPTVLTVACEGGGDVAVTMHVRQVQVAAFPVDCPVGSAGVGTATLDPGVVVGSFTVGVDASTQDVRWSLTVTQPE
ncbi:hypothetical protein ACFVW2_05330 [Streptomyces sp. NPDC058171]